MLEQYVLNDPVLEATDSAFLFMGDSGNESILA